MSSRRVSIVSPFFPIIASRARASMRAAECRLSQTSRGLRGFRDRRRIWRRMTDSIGGEKATAERLAEASACNSLFPEKLTTMPNL